MTQLITRCRFVALFAVAFCLVLSGCSGKGKPTKANFEKVKEDGMSVKEVEALMGPGKDGVPDEFNEALGAFGKIGGDLGVPGVKLEVPKITIKVWEEGNTQYVVFFKNDKSFKKTSGEKKEGNKGERKQTGDGDSKLTKANFLKIKTDMTKAEVEAILGPGKVIEKEGKGIQVYEWDIAGTKVKITFKDGKVTKTEGF